MTALDKYIRLESLGLWKEAPDKPAIEVLVSFGNATLVLSNTEEIPFSHWSLMATRLVSKNAGVSVFSADDEGFETLEIDDPEMIKAINMVTRAFGRPERKLNWGLWISLFLLVLAITGMFRFAPSFLLEQSVNMTSRDGARQLGNQILDGMELESCSQENADLALRKLENQIFPDGGYRVEIMKNAPDGLVLPGGIILLSYDNLTLFQSPSQLAAWIIASSEMRQNHYSVRDLMEKSSVKDLIIYTMTGNLPADRIYRATEDAHHISTSIANINTTLPDDGRYLQVSEWYKLYNICLE